MGDKCICPICKKTFDRDDGWNIVSDYVCSQECYNRAANNAFRNLESDNDTGEPRMTRKTYLPCEYVPPSGGGTLRMPELGLELRLPASAPGERLAERINLLMAAAYEYGRGDRASDRDTNYDMGENDGFADGAAAMKHKILAEIDSGTIGEYPTAVRVRNVVAAMSLPTPEHGKAATSDDRPACEQ